MDVLNYIFSEDYRNFPCLLTELTFTAVKEYKDRIQNQISLYFATNLLFTVN